MPKTFFLKYFALVFFLAGLGFIGKAGYIHAKAGLAMYLLRASWEESIKRGTTVKPWPWADTWPIARMIVPNHKIDLVVLEGDSGSVLAFGPGHTPPSSLPGQPGNSIISGHRDTSFRFLEKLQPGDHIIVQTRFGKEIPFRVATTRIIDEAILHMNVEADIPLLTLVTCYPFDAMVPGGPQRYVVLAEYDGEKVTVF